MLLTKMRTKRLWGAVALAVLVAITPAGIATASCTASADSCGTKYQVSGATFNSGGISHSCNPGLTICAQGAAGDLGAGLIGQDYSAVVKADSPVGFWRLGESSGTTAADSSGHGHNGTYAGGYKLGKPSLVRNTNTAASFDGAGTSAATVAGNTAFDINTTNQLAVEFWYQGTAVGNNTVNPPGFVSANADTGNKQWVVGMDASGHVVAVSVQSGGTYSAITGTTVVNDGKPHYIVANFNRSTAAEQIYVDGILDISTTVSSIGSWGNPAVKIGANGRSTGLAGTYDEVAVYSSTLSPTQIAKHYSTEFSSYQAQAGSVNTSIPYLEMKVGTYLVDAGVLKDDETHVGTATFSVKSYLAQGYQVTTNSPGPQNGSYTMNLLNPASGGAAGTEGFGMNLAANSCPANSSFGGTGNCSGSLGADPAQQPDSTFSYGYAAANYDTPGKYYYHDGDIIAHSNSSSGFTDYTISYIFNISGATPGGTYIMHQSLVTTSTF